MSAAMLLLLFFLNCSAAHAERLVIYVEDGQPYAYAKIANPLLQSLILLNNCLSCRYQPEIITDCP